MSSRPDTSPGMDTASPRTAPTSFRSLPVLLAFAEKVAKVHGNPTPELTDVDVKLRGLAGEMEAHMRSEEEEVFPAIRAGQGGSAALAQMEEEHEQAGDRVRIPDTDALETRCWGM